MANPTLSAIMPKPTGPARNVSAFILRALAVSALLLGIYFTLPQSVWIPLAQCNAALLSLLLRAAGLTPAVRGTVVSAGGYSVRVIGECLALEVALLLAAFIIAFPAPPRRKLPGAVFAAPLLFVANLIRIFAVFLIARADQRLFDLAHVYFGQVFIVLVVSAFAFLWMRSLADNGRGRAAVLFVLRLAFVSSVLFVCWIFLQHPYVELTEPFLQWVAGIATGARARFGERSAFAYTFNFVTLYALVISSTGIGIKRKALALAIGTALIVAFHLVFRTFCILSAAFHSSLAYRFSVGVFNFSGYLLPVLVWIAARYRRDEEAMVCPVCGRIKKGILMHMRVAHGKNALEKEEVREVVSRIERRKHGEFVD